MIAGAEVHLAEESFERGIGNDIGRVFSCRSLRSRSKYLPRSAGVLLRLRVEPDAVLRRQVADEKIDSRVMDPGRSIIDQRGALRSAQIRLIRFDEGLVLVTDDVGGGIQSMFHQARHRLVARSDLIEALRSL